MTSAPTLDFERGVGYPSAPVAGVDEVGRGCLAGPVHAAAVVLPAWDRPPEWLSRVRDSKLLAAEERAKLAPLIEREAASFAVASTSVAEIDRLNIFHAAHLAMERAVRALSLPPAHVLVDGNFLPKGLRLPATAIVQGDLKAVSIACASILAKVARDAEMERLGLEYPAYGFERHKGYPTPEHLAALVAHGPLPIHRRGFGPVAEAVASQSV